MIERIRGEIIEKDPGHVVVLTGGIGYGLDIPLSTHEALPRVGEQAELFVHTHVRAEALALFGFATRDEREAFLVLQSVSGIGPAMALATLSDMAPAALAKAVESGDTQRLTRIKGVGKKTAERLVLELRGRLKTYSWASGLVAGKRPIGLLAGHPHAGDAVQALVGLGMKEAQAETRIASAIHALGPDSAVEDLIKEGLKRR